MYSVSVRRAKKSDVLNLAKLNAESFSGNKTPKAAKLWMQNRFNDLASQIFVAEIDGKFAGYITWQIQGGWNRKEPVVELEQLAVAKEYQGAGVGTLLVDKTRAFLIDWVREVNENEIESIVLTVWVIWDNKPAIRLYRQFFELSSGLRVRYSRPENEMRATLVAPQKKAPSARKKAK